MSVLGQQANTSGLHATHMAQLAATTSWVSPELQVTTLRANKSYVLIATLHLLSSSLFTGAFAARNPWLIRKKPSPHSPW